MLYTVLHCLSHISEKKYYGITVLVDVLRGSKSKKIMDAGLNHILKNEIDKVVYWSKVDKEDYLLAMERSPIKDVEIKVLLKDGLTDEINSREVYMKGIDHSYYYEGYTTFMAEEL